MKRRQLLCLNVLFHLQAVTDREVGAMSESASVVMLKLKVSNRESGLLEWRPCECFITDDFRLVLKPSLPTDSDDEGDHGHSDCSASTVIAIDLATQLHHIEQKKKNKARCELVYASETSGRSSEELMAPSAKTCQQWVDRVREAQQSARRQVSIRQGATVASARAASVSPLPRDIGSFTDGSGGQELEEPIAERNVQPTVFQTSTASSRASSSAGLPVIAHTSVVDDGLDASSALGDQAEVSISNSKALGASAVSNSSMSSSSISFTLPPTVTTQATTDARGGGRQHHHQSFQSDTGVSSSQSMSQGIKGRSTDRGVILYGGADQTVSTILEDIQHFDFLVQARGPKTH